MSGISAVETGNPVRDCSSLCGAMHDMVNEGQEWLIGTVASMTGWARTKHTEAPTIRHTIQVKQVEVFPLSISQQTWEKDVVLQLPVNKSVAVIQSR